MRSGRSNVAVAWSLHTVIRRCSSRKNGRKECCTEYQGAMGGIRCLEWLIRNRKTEPLDRGWVEPTYFANIPSKHSIRKQPILFQSRSTLNHATCTQLLHVLSRTWSSTTLPLILFADVDALMSASPPPRASFGAIASFSRFSLPRRRRRRLLGRSLFVPLAGWGPQ